MKLHRLAVLPLLSAFASAEALKGEEIVVKAESLNTDTSVSVKTGTPILDVPSSISAYTEEQIELQGWDSIGDIVDYTPGVNTSQGEGHRDAVVFRGVRSTADFYQDGIRDDVQYYRSLYNVEQVEILKGPNALLFGRGGPGGVLNRISKKAEVAGDFTEYQVSVDTFGSTGLQFDQNYELNDSSAFRLNVMNEHLSNHRDHYDGKRAGVDLDYTKYFSDDTELRLSYEYVDHERFIDRGIPTNDLAGGDYKPVEGLKGYTFGDPELNKSLAEGHIFNFQLDHKFSDSWKSAFSVAFSDFDKSYQNVYVNDLVSLDTSNYANSEVELDGYLDTTQRTNLTVAGNLVGELETAGVEHKLVVGAEFIKTSSNQDRYNAQWSSSGTDKETFTVANATSLSNGVGLSTSGATSVNFNQDQADHTEVDVNVFSVYVQDEIALSDYLDLVVGARFDSFTIEENDIGNGGTQEKNNDSNISPRAGLIYKPVENASLYASYTESFIPSSGGQYANVGDGLDADKFSNLELGGKYEFESGLGLTAAVFQNEGTLPYTNDNQQIVDAESEVQGFELQLQGRVTNQWFVSAGYGYLDGTVIDVNSGVPEEDTPQELPAHTFSLWNSYDLNSSFGVGLGVIYQDESVIDIDDNDSGADYRMLPSYYRVDATAYYNINENYRVQLNVENLTDETYYPNAHDTHQATVGAPINARLTLFGKF